MEMRRGSVRIALAGLLLAACKSGGGAEDPKMGEAQGASASERGAFVIQGVGQGYDVASVRYRPGAVEVEFEADPIGGRSWGSYLTLGVDAAPSTVLYAATGEELDTIFEAEGILHVRAPTVETGTRHRIVLGFADSDQADIAALPRVASCYPFDRGTLSVVAGHSVPGEEGLPSLPAWTTYPDVILADFDLGSALRYATTIAGAGGAGTVEEASGEAEHAAALVAFCERELLARAPVGAEGYLGGPTAAWFGGMIAPETSLTEMEWAHSGERVGLGSDVSGHGVTALAGVLRAIYAETLPAGDRPSQRLGDDAWAVPRYMALRKQIGADAFREALREIVDRHRGGAPISFEHVATVFQDLSGDEAGAYVRAWLSSPAQPVVRTHWRFDSERKRLLLRVHQVHEAGGAVPAAYPLRVPLRVNFADGSMDDHTVQVSARRELVEVPCEGEPLAVTFDPDDQLVGICSLEVDE